MKLKSLDNFIGLTELREKMEAVELGSFELFDPQRHITYSEREALNEGSFQIQSQQMRILKDKTIAFKNTRLWLSWADEIQPLYHLAACDALQKHRHQKDRHSLQPFIAGTNPPENTVQVCVDCLQLLKYQGLDARRGRRLDTDTVQKEFDFTQFQKDYPFYPLI